MFRQGLGTSTAKEAKEYFAALDTHQLEFEWKDDSIDNDLIDMAFSKKRGIHVTMHSVFVVVLVFAVSS